RSIARSPSCKSSPLRRRPEQVPRFAERGAARSLPGAYNVSMAKKKKVRVDLRKNRSKPPRQGNWTRRFDKEGAEDSAPGQERVRAKGELSRRRTIITSESQDATTAGQEPADMP